MFIVRASTFLIILTAATLTAAPPDFVPRDYGDVPVRVEIENDAQLQRFERMLPGRGPDAHDHLVDGEIEVRVTADELARLERAGFRVERLDDVEQAARSQAESTWATLAEPRGLDDFTWPLSSYPTHAEVGTILADLQALRPDIAQRYSYGNSVEGRPLWGIVVSDHPDSNEVEPEVRLASGIHGDETVQMVNLLNLVVELVTEHGTGDARIDALVDGTELHVQPLFNPDGYARGVRRNANGVDLNRNFPEPAGPSSGQQPETLSFMDHALSKHFVVSLMGHGGALVVNYPWDYTAVRAPDDLALIQLSLEYSRHNLPMFNGNFSQGITNGSDWYEADGTLQDWAYHRTGCFDVTLEVSNTKWPSAGSLPGYWQDNRESLLHFVEAARAGLSGVVTDAVTGAPLDATIRVAEIDRLAKTDPITGDFYKLLDTGGYTVTVDAVGYRSQTFFRVSTVWGVENRLDVALAPDVETDVPSVARGPRIDRVAPNPFNPRTRIEFTLPRAATVRLEIVDVRGRRVRQLVERALAAGGHDVVWEGDDDGGRQVSSGVYFVRLVADGMLRTASLTLVQ